MQAMRSFPILRIDNSLFIQTINSHFAGGMNNVINIQHNSHMGYSPILVLKESHITGFGV
jgi:S-adenosylmethionine/arginine decarboxylase-like enzyme